MDRKQLTEWLLRGDVSIQYQTHRDLFFEQRNDLQERIANEGWGAEFISKRHDDGHWGMKFYQPKWTSSHYTLLDLRNLCVSPDNQIVRESVKIIADNEKGADGGINPAGSIKVSDVCINGMFLNYASWFKLEQEKLESIVDFILTQHMADGGFNCRSNRSGAKHSSLHTTLSVLEGITEYEKNGYLYRAEELASARKKSVEFILMHHLFLSDHTGDIIHKDFLKLAYPGRWRYDILRALDYFQYSEVSWDERMIPAIEVLLKKRNKDGRWNVQSKHPGQVHFEMEKAGAPSRWNTMRAMRFIEYYKSYISSYE